MGCWVWLSLHARVLPSSEHGWNLPPKVAFWAKWASLCLKTATWFTQEEGGFVVTRKLPKAKVGDLLILHGETNGYSHEKFSDTNNIISLDEKNLVIGQDGYSVTYQRK